MFIQMVNRENVIIYFCNYSWALLLRHYRAYPPGFVAARIWQEDLPNTRVDGLRPLYPPTAARRPPHRMRDGAPSIWPVTAQAHGA